MNTIYDRYQYMITVKTLSFIGIKVVEIDVQVHFANGNPGITIVGLGDKAVAESRERIKAVVSSIGLNLPPKRITVNLAPADLVKEGTHFDLPIAIGILCGIGAIDKNSISDSFFLGELSLDGTLNSVNGILPAAIHSNIKGKRFVCPAANANEAVWGGNGLDVVAPKHILHLVNYLKGLQAIEKPQLSSDKINLNSSGDFLDVIGQDKAKMALMVAAAGGHNILMIGPPGTGKSMLAARLNTILPNLDPQEMLEVSVIYSVAGMIENGKLSMVRPFRNPHHSASMPSIIGGGKNSKPGEISLAHCGILFLDELPEYPRVVVDSLRQPIENKEVSISRINAKVNYPANFQLVAAMNPCKCGYFGSKKKQCQNPKNCAEKYQSRVSGPIMDRFDIKIKMEEEDYNITNHLEYKSKFTSKDMKENVISARKLQMERYKNYGIRKNADLDSDLIKEFCIPKEKEAQNLIDQTASKMNLSMRSISRILKVGRTISDLKNEDFVSKNSILEAIEFNIGSGLLI